MLALKKTTAYDIKTAAKIQFFLFLLFSKNKVNKIGGAGQGGDTADG